MPSKTSAGHRARKEEEQKNRAIPERFPYLVTIIDELANLMQTASQNMETDIGILTRGTRAAGIRLIVAMQTPKRQVVTGMIKANIPTRVAFQVAKGTDSRVILDRQGRKNWWARETFCICRRVPPR
ncbi:FtsK/SpoIIIE domain-containing protein [Akkermansia sp.]|uniref:FtsK/SpoIIIE domain-containing protein n=1 Tax=Akkermansia sp. TaxID=1872421 RepID=UPI003AB35E7B